MQGVGWQILRYHALVSELLWIYQGFSLGSQREVLAQELIGLVRGRLAVVLCLCASAGVQALLIPLQVKVAGMAAEVRMIALS